jgi:hypothetical protein
MNPPKETKIHELSRLLTGCHVKLTNSLELLAKGNVDGFRESETKRLAELSRLESLIPNLKKSLDDSKHRRKKNSHMLLVQELTRRNSIHILGSKERAISQARQVLKNSLSVPRPMSMPCSTSEIYGWLRSLSQPNLVLFSPYSEDRRFMEDTFSPEELPAVQRLKALGPHFCSIDSVRYDISFTTLDIDLVIKFSVRNTKPRSLVGGKIEPSLFIENISFFSLLEENGRMSFEEINKMLKADFLPKKSEEKFHSLLTTHKRLSVYLQASESEYFNQLGESFKIQLEESLAFTGDSGYSFKRLFSNLKELIDILKAGDGVVCRKCRQYGMLDDERRGWLYPTFMEKRKFVHQKCLDKFTNKGIA